MGNSIVINGRRHFISKKRKKTLDKSKKSIQTEPNKAEKCFWFQLGDVSLTDWRFVFRSPLYV